MREEVSLYFLRRFLVPGLWEIATTAAASFTGAWLWRLHTPPDTVILYYLVWFGVMTGVFGVAAVTRYPAASRTMQALGLSVAIIYISGGLRRLGQRCPGMGLGLGRFDRPRQRPLLAGALCPSRAYGACVSSDTIHGVARGGGDWGGCCGSPLNRSRNCGASGPCGLSPYLPGRGCAGGRGAYT